MKEEKTFESALNELEGIVKDLESGNIELDNAMNKYTKAMNLVKFCQEKLDNATNQVNKILNENDELVDFKMNEGEENGEESN